MAKVVITGSKLKKPTRSKNNILALYSPKKNMYWDSRHFNNWYRIKYLLTKRFYSTLNYKILRTKSKNNCWS